MSRLDDLAADIETLIQKYDGFLLNTPIKLEQGAAGYFTVVTVSFKVKV